MVRQASDADRWRWNEFLEARPLASPLARYEWRWVLADSYATRTTFCLVEREGGLAGALAAYVTGGRRPRLHSLRGGLQCEDSHCAEALFAWMEAERQAHGADRFVATSGISAAPAPYAPILRKTVVLPISGDEEAVWRGLRDKTRNMVRKAQKLGLRVEAGFDRLADFHAIYAAEMTRLGVPYHSLRHFRAIAQHLGDVCELLSAVKDERTVAGMLLFRGREVACYPYQAVAPEHRSSGAIQLLNWEALRRSASAGLKLLDMGESRVGSPVFQSKINFGGEPRDVHYYEAPPPAALASDAPQRRNWRGEVDRYLSHAAPGWARRFYLQWKLRRGRLQ